MQLLLSLLSMPPVRGDDMDRERQLRHVLTVNVCPEVPALAEASWNALSTASDTERWMSTEAVSVASVGWPAAEAVAVLDTVAGATEEIGRASCRERVEAPVGKAAVE